MRIFRAFFVLLTILILSHCASVHPKIDSQKIDDKIRAKQIKAMRYGMFICWSFSTFYGKEWTPTLDKDAFFFNAVGCDTDQWCKTAKEAGMGYILFLSKHHTDFVFGIVKPQIKK